ncbi:MAG TPA: aminotransferase class III-fold pyridoxal phosphate-dependent enzyme [Verrucomicrobium sp.]|nr:aminotransferase class III-fold pyridoxal phosphate-dependent enzyme [Verrucomicrobium sp.]
MSQTLIEKYVMPNYGRYDFWPERGQGTYVWDRDGKKYLDFAGGVAVCPVGHCHPEVVKAIQDQAAKLIHISNWYQIRQQGELAEMLVEKVMQIPGKCFFCNSGAEANEGLIKLSRRFGVTRPKADGSPRYEIITCTGSFHGRTFATMTATAQEKIHGGFGPLLPGFKYIPFNDVASLEVAVNENTVAILFEPLQGESGVNVATPEFLRAAAALRDQHDLLLLFDEVQCGLGRTGELGGWRSIIPGNEILPDAISWAKSIGSGYALGSFWARDRAIGPEIGSTKLCDLLGAGTHGTTYGGSPLACATAIATLNVILRDDLVGHSKAMGVRIVDEVLSWNLPAINTVRGHGFMLGFELNTDLIEGLDAFKASGKLPSIWVTRLLMDAGLLVVPAGPKVIRWLAPMNTTEAEAQEGLAIMKSILSQLA